MTEEAPFVEGIKQAAREILTEGSDELHNSVQELLEMAVIVTVRTPHPETREGFFLGEPTNEPWISLYGYYTEAILPVTALVIALSITMILFTGIFGTFLSGYERSRAKRRLVVAFIFVLAWWGIGTFVLRFVDALAVAISPPPGVMAETLADPMTIDGMGTVSGAALSLIEGFVFLFLIIWYILRWIGIYALMVAMPLAVAFWIVDVGPFAYLSAMIEDLATKFIPLAFITVPAAVIYRVGDLLFVAFEPQAEFGHPVAPFMFALGFPFLVLIVSYYVFFKMPSIRVLRRSTPAATERQTVEKGRGTTEEPVDRTSLHKGREVVDDRGTVTEDRGRRRTDPPTTSASGGRSRPTRTYQTERAAETPLSTREVSRSRRKVSELGRWS